MTPPSTAGVSGKQSQTVATDVRSNKCFIKTAALIIIPLIYFYPVLLSQVVLAPGDGWAQNFAVRVLTGQMIGRGELPLWNPFIFGGMPLAASVYPGAFYPLNWLFAILPDKWAINTIVLATYYLALVGTYFYARRVGIACVGALLAATAFTFGGFMINHLSHTSRIAAAAWLPWVLLAIENIASSKSWSESWRWVALGALFIALQFLAGEPQMMVFTAIVSAPFTIFALLKCDSIASRLRFTIAISTMLLCGVLLSMIQLLPSLELLSQSERNDPGPAFFGVYSFPPWQLPGLIFPYFFGGAMFPPYRVPYWGQDIAAIMSGYVGMLAWVLAFAAIFSARRNVRVWLWVGVAVVSMTLAFGGHLPFELNHALYRIPGYKIFRGLYKHQFEFTFAMSMLAGFGVSYLRQLDRQSAHRTLWRSTIAMSAVVTVTAILYLFFGDALAAVNPRPPQAASLTNAEIIVPVFFFALSLITLWIYQASGLKPQVAGFILVTVLLIDTASYGHFFHWRITTFDVNKRLADPPAVQLIKSRENNFNSFRVMSHPVQAYDYAYYWPEDPNFELINQPNISILRGLQSVSGYDILRPVRVGEITGTAGAAINGFVQDMNSFNAMDRGLDLLNVKYLIVGHGGATGKKVGFTYDSIYFARTNFGVEFKPGVNLTTEPNGVMANEIGIVSTLANSTHLPDGAPILKLRMYAHNGKVIERELQAGRDTSEWAYDRADVRENIKHKCARIVESNKSTGFEAHYYLGRLRFDRAEIEKIEWTYTREDASLYLIRASLYDEATGVSTPLPAFHLPPERWRKLARFDQVEVFENLQVMPRAWFVRELVEMPRETVIKTIRTGVLPEGKRFDPLSMALVEKETPQRSVVKGTYITDAAESSRVKIRRYEPNRIEIETHKPEEGFLVLSEVFYSGWKAYVDGKEQPIFRTNYTLRGINVPRGDHKIEFTYSPQSFRNGAMYTSFGLVLLILIHPRMLIHVLSDKRSRN